MNDFTAGGSPVLTSNQLRFRWFTCNCYEFILPGGKHFLVDPMLIGRDFQIEGPFEYNGFDVSDLSAADYVFVNHTHLDHIASLREVYDRFGPRILIHESCAAVASEDLDIPQTAFFPYGWNQTFDFGDFKITTLPARHNGIRRPSERVFKDDERQFARCGTLGTLFNTNFILETKNHLKIGFCAGVYRDGEVEKNVWKGTDIHIFIRQFGGRLLRNDAEGLAEEFKETGASILLPLHQERFYDGKLEGDLDEMTEKVNQLLASDGYAGRMLSPQRGKWYSVNMIADLSS